MAFRPSIALLTTLTVAAPSLLLAGALVWLVDSTGRRVADELSEQYLRSLVRQAESDLGDYSAGMSRLSQRYAEAVRSGYLPIDDRAKWETELRLDVAARLIVHSLIYVPEHGPAVWAQRREDGVRTGTLEDSAPLREAWHAAAGAPVANGISEPAWRIGALQLLPADEPEWMVGQARTLRTPNGQTAGVIVVNVMPEALRNKLRARLPTPDSIFYLVDPDGMVLASSAPVSARAGVRERLADAAPEIAGSNGSDGPVALAGEPARVNFGELKFGDGLKMQLAAVVPERAFLGESGRATRGALGVALVASGAALALGAILSNLLVRPVRATVRRVRSIQAGDLTARSDYPTPAVEWEELRVALEAMAQRLAERETLQAHLAAAAERLRDSEARYKSLFDEAPEGILVVSTTRDKVLDVNEAACRMFGRTREDLLAQNGAGLSSMLRSPAEGSGPSREEIRERLAREGRAAFRARYRRASGEEFVADVVVVPHETPGGERTIRATIIDVSESVRSQQAIERLNTELEERVRERTVQLREINAELEAFTYSVSHDLRAPLRHIDGFVQLLDRHNGPTADAATRRYTGVIGESARKMGALIDDLLSFSRVARAEPHHEDVPMDALVDEAIALLAPAAAGRTIDWEREPMPTVRGDRALLRQVWVNLLDNALKYTSKVERARIHISARRADHEWAFSVADNGAGFDPRYAAKLFGVFQRLHTEGEFPGTGIGLATVRRIILRHGGRTWAEGKPGEGATFSFSLPLKEDQS